MKLSSFLLASVVGFIGVKAQSISVPYPDSPFFIEHAHTELVADVNSGTPIEGEEIIINNEKKEGNDDQLWSFTHEGYIQNKKTNLYLAIQGYHGQAIDPDTPVIQSSNPQIWEYYNGALSIPGLHYGLSLQGGSEAANTFLVINDLNIFDRSQQFRLERLVEKEKCDQTNH
ncbi:unnamed protein product [Cunninghamella echinulata]